MQAQAAKRFVGSRYLIAAIALAILLGVAFVALVVADVIDRSDATSPAIERVVAESDASFLPEEAIDGQYYDAAPGSIAVPYDVTRFLEQNLVLPGDNGAAASTGELQQQAGERDSPIVPETSPTNSYDYRDWVSGRWTSGLTER